MAWLFNQSAFLGGLVVLAIMALVFGIWNLIERSK